MTTPTNSHKTWTNKGGGLEMRIVIVTQGDNMVFRRLQSELCSSIVGIIESAPRGFRAAGGIAGRPTKLSLVCKRRCIPYVLLHSHNEKEVLLWLTRASPDLVIVYCMSQLLSREFLRVPRHGAINLHPSALPAYRGPNPWLWIYRDHQKIGGVTLHFIDEGEDTGDIIDQQLFDIPSGIRLPALLDMAIKDYGLGMILNAVAQLESNHPLPRFEQPRSATTLRARNIAISEHQSLIEWKSWPLTRIWHFMRGTESWLNCIEQPRGLFRYTRWSVGNFRYCSTYQQSPDSWGAIFKDKHGYHVACRDGIIIISHKNRPFALLRALYKSLSRYFLWILE